MKTSDVNGQVMVLNEDYVNIYRSPDFHSGVISQKYSGVEIILLTLVKDSRGKRWFKIKTSEEEGYIDGDTGMLTREEQKQWSEELKRDFEERRVHPEGMVIESMLFSKGIIGGLLLMIAGLVWLIAGYSMDVIYIYPIILIFIGMAAIIRHLISAKKDENFFIVVALLVFIGIATLFILATV